jgi:signal transduction histidine kinase
LQQENLKDLLNNAERLLSLIDGLLDIAKIEAGKLEVHVEPVDLEKIIGGAVLAVGSTVSGNHVQVIRYVAPDLPILNTDRDKIAQIMLNLLDNAAKFTERGEIRVIAARHNGSLKLVVSDTGIGIPEQDLNRIFEEFHRARPANGKKYHGTGLGLAIVKRLVDLLGGSIEVCSEVNVGSTFTVTLPLDHNSKTAA